MRKIYQSAPDVPQALANKAVDIIERHFAANGVRRAEELPEESKIRLLRDLSAYFQAELPNLRERGGELAYESSGRGLGESITRWFRRIFGWESVDSHHE